MKKAFHAIPLSVCVAFLLILGAVLFVDHFWPVSIPTPQSRVPSLDKTRPAFTEAVRTQLASSKGFSALISYTDAGFQPEQVSIKQGDSVRFTNNSSSDLWIASAGADAYKIYPGKSDCGGTALDTCKVLKPHEFWEFTFDKSGTWLFHNNLDKSKSGVMKVTVK